MDKNEVIEIAREIFRKFMPSGRSWKVMPFGKPPRISRKTFFPVWKRLITTSTSMPKKGMWMP
jgi:hypothetical protein